MSLTGIINLFFALTLAAVSSIAAAQVPDLDRQRVLLAVLKEIDPGEHEAETLLFASTADPATLVAAASIRSTLTANQLPAASPFSIPPKHLRIHEFVIAKDKATVGGSLGPILKPSPGEISLHCGVPFRFELMRMQSGTWTITQRMRVVC